MARRLEIHGSAVHGCCNTGEGAGTVILSGVNEVPH